MLKQLPCSLSLARARRNFGEQNKNCSLLRVNRAAICLYFFSICRINDGNCVQWQRLFWNDCFIYFFVSRLISLCCCQWKRGKSINTLLLSFCQQFDTLRVSALNALLALSVCVCKLFCHKNVFVKSTSVLFDSAVYTCNRIEGIAKFYFSAFEHRLTVGTELFLCIRSSALISA